MFRPQVPNRMTKLENKNHDDIGVAKLFKNKAPKQVKVK